MVSRTLYFINVKYTFCMMLKIVGEKHKFSISECYIYQTWNVPRCREAAEVVSEAAGPCGHLPVPV